MEKTGKVRRILAKTTSHSLGLQSLGNADLLEVHVRRIINTKEAIQIAANYRFGSESLILTDCIHIQRHC